MSYIVDDTATLTINVGQQPTGVTITGMITDILGRPVSNAFIIANDKSTSSDINGMYTIENLPVGIPINITVTHKDYLKYTTTKTYLTSGIHTVNIQLIPMILVYAGLGFTALIIVAFAARSGGGK